MRAGITNMPLQLTYKQEIHYINTTYQTKTHLLADLRHEFERFVHSLVVDSQVQHCKHKKMHTGSRFAHARKEIIALKDSEGASDQQRDYS